MRSLSTRDDSRAENSHCEDCKEVVTVISLESLGVHYDQLHTLVHFLHSSLAL